MADFRFLSLPGARVTLGLHKRSRYFQLRRVRPSPLQQHLHRHITPPHQRVLAASSASVAHFAPSFLPCLVPHNRSPVAGGRAAASQPSRFYRRIASASQHHRRPPSRLFPHLINHRQPFSFCFSPWIEDWSRHASRRMHLGERSPSRFHSTQLIRPSRRATLLATPEIAHRCSLSGSSPGHKLFFGASVQ